MRYISTKDIWNIYTGKTTWPGRSPSSRFLHTVRSAVVISPKGSWPRVSQVASSFPTPCLGDPWLPIKIPLGLEHCAIQAPVQLNEVLTPCCPGRVLCRVDTGLQLRRHGAINHTCQNLFKSNPSAPCPSFTAGSGSVDYGNAFSQDQSFICLFIQFPDPCCNNCLGIIQRDTTQVPFPNSKGLSNANMSDTCVHIFAGRIS